MRNTVLSYFMLPLLAVASFSLNAATASAVSTPAAIVSEVPSRLDLNTADAGSLQSGLIGIGKAKAQAIVDYRDEHGAFATVDELLEVKGIGQALLDRNRDRLTVDN
jgi:competence protein ComEA